MGFLSSNNIEELREGLQLPVQEVLETLEKILRLVDGQTAALLSRALPSVHMNFTCPKVTVQLRSSTFPSRSFSVSRMHYSAGLSSALVCQLSLHELQLAEERVDRACNSWGLAGQSPKSCPQRVVKASIGRLHLSTAAEQAASADVLPPESRVPSCMATSPAACEENPQRQVRTDVANLLGVHSTYIVCSRFADISQQCRQLEICWLWDVPPGIRLRTPFCSTAGLCEAGICI